MATTETKQTSTAVVPKADNVQVAGQFTIDLTAADDARVESKDRQKFLKLANTFAESALKAAPLFKQAVALMEPAQDALLNMRALIITSSGVPDWQGETQVYKATVRALYNAIGETLTEQGYDPFVVGQFRSALRKRLSRGPLVDAITAYVTAELPKLPAKPSAVVLEKREQEVRENVNAHVRLSPGKMAEPFEKVDGKLQPRKSGGRNSDNGGGPGDTQGVGDAVTTVTLESSIQAIGKLAPLGAAESAAHAIVSLHESLSKKKAGQNRPAVQRIVDDSIVTLTAIGAALKQGSADNKATAAKRVAELTVMLTALHENES